MRARLRRSRRSASRAAPRPQSLRFRRSKHQIAREQPPAQPRVTPAHELDPYVVEPPENGAHRVRREHAQVGRVVLRRSAAEEAQAALDAKRVGNGADERAPWPEHPMDLRDQRVWELEVLEELTGDDGVETPVIE